MTAPRAPRGLEKLRLHGELVLPSDPGYPLAVQLQNTEYDTATPCAVAYCATPEDVAACVRFARDDGVRAHIRAGGHSFNGWSTGEGFVIDLSRINGVALGGLADAPTVRLGGGVQSLDALDALKPLGRQIVTGTFPTVGAGGFLTGGGIGWQTRRFGLGGDRVVAARVVLADGRTVRCSADEEPELFWALRGGGGGTFGVVTEFEVRPIEAPVLTGFETLWAYEDAVAVLVAWQEWCVRGPDELGSSLVVLPGMFGPGGRPVVKVWGVDLRPAEELRRSLDELAERAGTKPVGLEVGVPGAYADVMHQALCGSDTVAQCHRTGTGPQARGHRHPYTRQSYRLTGRPVDRTEAAALLAAWEAEPFPERYLLCIAVGGAASRVGRTETAYAHRDARFLMGYQIACRDPRPSDGAAAAMTAWADRCATALEPLACGSYINFPSSRVSDGWEADYFGENHARLTRVKREYDPDGFFRHAQSVGGRTPIASAHADADANANANSDSDSDSTKAGS
ncbi:FAD-binding protein [Streptomyces sp. NPDC046203]|uniref:FAD-binding oxidoreductase n=1 Tax=Streptomyces sp. NPDC046203 TaxID=3154602 RepID=UPI003404A121